MYVKKKLIIGQFSKSLDDMIPVEEIIDRGVRYLVRYLGYLGYLWIPGEENIDPGVCGDDDDEGQEEDLAVVQSVVDVRPVVRTETNYLGKFFS